MDNIEILKLKDRHRIIKEHNFDTMAEVEAYRKAIDDYHAKQLTLTDVRFELPSDEIFKQGIVNLKNPLEEFYYYEAPDHSKWELTEFRESLKKALTFLKGN